MNTIIKIDRKYKLLKHEISLLSYSIGFQKDYMISMMNNLSNLNSIKLFQDTNSLYLSILSEIKQIKQHIDKYNNIIACKNIITSNIIQLHDIINDMIIKFSNHISSDNINYIIKLLTCDEWYENYNLEDLEKLQFVTRFIKPISTWDSSYHIKEVNVLPSEKSDELILVNKKKSAAMTKEIIDSLLNNTSQNINSIIINNNHTQAPGFLKTINDLIEMNSNMHTIKRTCHYNVNECNVILGNNNIVMTKNVKSSSLIEDKNGVCIYIKYITSNITNSNITNSNITNSNITNSNITNSNITKIIVIQGIFKDDLLNIAINNKFIQEKYNKLKADLSFNILNIPSYFKNNYLKIISLRDIIVMSSEDIMEDIKKKFNDFKTIQIKSLLPLINEFLLASKYRKIDILTLLLMSNDDDHKIAFILFDVFKTKDKKDVATEVYQSLHYSIREMLDNSGDRLNKEESELMKITESDIPYERRISLINSDDSVKIKAMEKLKAMKSSFQGDAKAQSWLDGLLKIPFNVYNYNSILNFKSEFIKRFNIKLFSDDDINKHIMTLDKTDMNRIEWEEYTLNKTLYLKDVRSTLDKVVYGHMEAKIQLERLFAQWINGNMKGAVLGLQGPPGTGKTSLAKNGLSQCLKDNNNMPRPFAFLPIGGSVNGSTLVGHNFTYVGSTWGRIADILMTSGCMNPIIFIDEVDKVSHTEHGREIISILTHLTDSTQNDEFEDKFFSGIKLDLSKALIVFSFNDPNLIDPILRDRITIIETKALSIKEKLTIIKDYMLPEICSDVGFNCNEIIFSDDIITFMIETYTNEAGVRKIKEKIVEIIRDINLNRFHKPEHYILPIVITKEYIMELFENKPKVRVKTIHSKPEVGTVNGLYASSAGGIGGITPIQVMKFPATKMLELNITGKAGDVMKESVEYSLKNAYSLLSKEKQDVIISDANNKNIFGLHIHFPDGATPKDGPSAGLAITLAFYSILSGIPVKNDICMTGEIDLRGMAGIIGGLEAKLNGGKKAGCKVALIPKDNMEDLERIRREGNSPESDDFKVIPVEHIREVLEYALVL
jgi:hypothetical protein